MLYTADLILYRTPHHGKILAEMTDLMDTAPAGGDLPGLRRRLFAAVGEVTRLAERYGMSGNLWQGYLCYLLACHENPYSLACEMTGKAEPGLREMALHDCAIFRRLFSMDVSAIDQELGVRCADYITHYTAQRTANRPRHHVGARMGQLREQLAGCLDDEAFLECLAAYYKTYGVGRFGLYRAFKLADDDTARIVPIVSTRAIHLDDLVGYTQQKQELVKNTEDFLAGRGGNNVLLFGDSGTGKSSSIQAILSQYWGQGLRMIEIYKHQFRQLTAVIHQIKDRGYKFIIYMDDLSFEDFETDYKYLKAVIDGGLETKPDNVLIYATSNRRHLVREQYSDRSDLDDDLHRSETMQEKLSLAARFGLSIFYVRPDRDEYTQIVKVLAQRHGVRIPPAQLAEQAARWELRNGGMSGRTAQQFINYIVGDS